jgi:hypothetical protein
MVPQTLAETTHPFCGLASDSGCEHVIDNKDYANNAGSMSVMAMLRQLPSRDTVILPELR